MAQNDEPSIPPEATATEVYSYRSGRLPPDAFRTDPAVGSQYRDLFRNSRSPYELGLRTPDPELGVHNENTRIGFRVGIPDVTGLNGGKAFDPERADLKVGPLYFKLNALTGAILASDNPDHAENGSDPDAIAIVRLAATIVAQVTESLRLAVSGSIIWLPFEGKVGLTSGSLLDGIRFRDLVRAQVSWDTHIGEWDVFLSDTFRIYPENPTYDFTLYEGTDFDAQDRMGNYSYGSYNYVSRYQTRRDSSYNSLTEQSLVYSNEVAAVAERLLPGPVRLRIRAYHEDLYYNQGSRGAPLLREGASILLKSEREDWRFNPFARYEINRTHSDGGFSQLMAAGITGPITDQLNLSLYTGYYIGAGSQSDRGIAGLRLDHQAGPYTRETLFVGREIRQYEDESFDSVRYNIRQTLGPHLSLDAYVSYGIATDLKDTGNQRNELSTGAILDWGVGPRTDIQLACSYRDYSSNDAGFLEGDDHLRFSGGYSVETVHFALGYRITETVHARILYQFLDQESSSRNNTFRENLILLSLTKYFE